MTTIQPHNQKAAQVWGAGGSYYEEVSRGVADAIQHGIQRLNPLPHEKVLDLATGTGWAARGCAVKGAKVVGIDIGEELIEAARAISNENHIPIDFQVADAESLPFEDESFDKVISTFGVMFVSHPEAAAAEMARVCKKGGKVALATWHPTSNVMNLFLIMKSFMPPPPSPSPPSPFEWGKKERVKQLLSPYFDLGFEEGVNYLRENSGAAAWEIFSKGYGPLKSLASKLNPEDHERLKNDFISLHERFRNDLGIAMPRDYLITVGTRRS